MNISIMGCGLRTPLLIYGLAHSDMPVKGITLYDTDTRRAALMTALGTSLCRGTSIVVRQASSLEETVDNCDFFVSSFREGGMETRARDERICVQQGFVGQETTGAAGFAMAMRSIPVAIHHAATVAAAAPHCWIINFTNPAGILTQAISTCTHARVVGICDTPGELFHRIAFALEMPLRDLTFDYVGLNHLGWVRSVSAGGRDLLPSLLEDEARLRTLYPAELFDVALLRSLGLLPTEYLFFYYNQRAAWHNQNTAGATRGEELRLMNATVLDEMSRLVQSGDTDAALRVFRCYLNRRNASYLRLEAAGESMLTRDDPGWDPFQGATGYHRIAIDTIRSLHGQSKERIVLNVRNNGCIADLDPSDVIEVPCVVDRCGPMPIAAGAVPELVRGLLISVKTYERLTIRAAKDRSNVLAVHALFANPMIADWDSAFRLWNALRASDQEHFAGFEEQEGTH